MGARLRFWGHVALSLALLTALFAVLLAEIRQPLVTVAVLLPAIVAWVRLTIVPREPPE